MKCPQCGSEINENSKLCDLCGHKIDMNIQSDNSIYVTKFPEKINDNLATQTAEKFDASKPNKSIGNGKIPFYFRMWFISLIFWSLSFVFGLGTIVATILFVIRMVKYPNFRKKALISAGIQIAFIVAITVWFVSESGKNDRAINKLLDEGKYAEAIEYVEINYDSTEYGYYAKLAEIYEKQGDYDSAVSYILKYTEIMPDITEINDNVISKLKLYKGKISSDNENAVRNRIDEIIKAKAAKEAAEKQAAEEQAAKEAAEKKAAEEQAVKEAAEKKAAEEQAAKEAAEREAAEKKEAAEREAAEKKEAEEQAAEREAAEKKAAADAIAAEQKAKEDEAKEIEQNAQILGVDLVMESHSSVYDDKYFKTEGTIEQVDRDSYRIRYLSTVNNHRRMYKAWIITNDTSSLYVGENVFVVAKYAGFAKDSTVPTLNQYKIDKSSNSFYSVLSSKAKVINRDITFENLLRYGKYQDYVYIEGKVSQVYETCLNIVDEYGNLYVVFDERASKNVILQGDYIKVYGSFDGIDKSGYVWPLVTWLVDGNQ